MASYRKIYVEPNYNLVTDTETRAGAAIMQIFNQLQDRYLIGEITVDQWVASMKGQADEAIRKAG